MLIIGKNFHQYFYTLLIVFFPASFSFRVAMRTCSGSTGIFLTFSVNSLYRLYNY